MNLFLKTTAIAMSFLYPVCASADDTGRYCYEISTIGLGSEVQDIGAKSFSSEIPLLLEEDVNLTEVFRNVSLCKWGRKIRDICLLYGRLRRIDFSRGNVKDFIDESCSSVLNYYNEKRESILEQARQAAGMLMARIEPYASCRDRAELLAGEIKKRIGEEWTLTMKMYDESVSIEKQRIDAAREVEIA